jgi:hypothetical protein
MGLSNSQFIRRTQEHFERQKSNGKLLRWKVVGGQARHFFLRDKWAFVPQRDHPGKVFVVEKLHLKRVEGNRSRQRHRQQERVEYRIGYYIVKKKGSGKGQWGWGQSCPLIPAQDLPKLLREIKRLGY